MPRSRQDIKLGDFVSFHEPMLKTVAPENCNVWQLKHGIVIDVTKKVVLVLCEGEFFNVNQQAVSYDSIWT